MEIHHHHHHSNNYDVITKRTFFNKYKPIKKLGEGSFGKIYSAININTNEKFALKMELKESNQNLLEAEAHLICYLKGFGVPSVKSYGYSGEYNILVMELLGKSLEDLFQEQKKKFSIKTVSMIGIQMLERIEFIHKKFIIHRDIKPDNFVMGLDKKNYIVYILDFGLSKKYRSIRTRQHIKFTSNKKLTGTARYASINALKGCEQSRRDDLESIGYVLMYFLKGSLPWQGLQINKGEDRYKKIYIKKKNTSAESLCEGFPNEFRDYVNYTRNLGFEDDPDYNYLKSLFFKVLERENCIIDFYYDWMKEKPEISNSFYNKYLNDKNINKRNFNIDEDKENNDDNFNGKILKTSYNEISGFGIDNNLKSNINMNRVHTTGNEEKKNDINYDNNNNDNNKKNDNTDETCFVF